MDHLRKEVPGLLLEQLQEPPRPWRLPPTRNYSPLVLSWGRKHGSHMVTGPCCMGHGPAHGSRRVLDTVGHTGTVVALQHDDTPHKAASSSWRYEGLGGFQNSTVRWWCQGPWMPSSAGHWCPVRTDSAPGTPVFNRVALFPLALTRPFCCTANRRLLVLPATGRIR
jgi:hypothetical protein